MLARTTDEKESVKEFLDLLASSPQGSFLADKEFGFTLMNRRFENIENDYGLGRRFWSKKQNTDESQKTVNGSSKNNTYAKDLKESIEKYEPRLENVTVDEPVEETDRIVFPIKGICDGKPMDREITINVW